jgi:hypothetical protein
MSSISGELMGTGGALVSWDGVATITAALAGGAGAREAGVKATAEALGVEVAKEFIHCRSSLWRP